jgi:hypothetical protein
MGPLKSLQDFPRHDVGIAPIWINLTTPFFYLNQPLFVLDRRDMTIVRFKAPYFRIAK